MRLRYCTVDSLENLRRTVPERLDWYYAPQASSLPMSLGGFREASLQAPELANKLALTAKQPSTTDAANALAVYGSLRDLTPHQASIERLWVYLCHFDCPQYVSVRWLTSGLDNDELATREIRNHFFATGNRGVIRDNGISRLWWLGKVAHEVDPDNPEQFLELLLHRQDVRSALIERPSVSMNRRVLRAIYEVMREHWNNGGTLFERKIFRNWMIALNRRGGVILLDALPDAALDRLLRDEAEIAVDQAGGK
ncbi:MAG: hypothetical protein F4X56_02195 [Gammaproteobacteria bacterium]|nr:hypothetical protein [Gammaproteobacteria bacterium]